MEKVISILGCGWLGLPLAKFLIEKNFTIKGSTTSPHKLSELRLNQIQAHHLVLDPKLCGETWDDFLENDILIINIPPRSMGKDFHFQQIQNLLQKLTNPKEQKIIYISSTSVYPNVNRVVTEDDATMDGTNKNLPECEKLLKNQRYKTTILRCGGLMGKDRIPARYFVGRTVDTGEFPVNYIHLEDVIQIIYQVIIQEKWDKTWNLVTPKRRKRREVFEKNIADFGFENIHFKHNPNQDYKIVSSEKLQTELDYTFVYSDPIDFTYQKY